MKGSCGTAENVQFSFAHEICKKIKKCNFIFCFVYIQKRHIWMQFLSLTKQSLRIKVTDHDLRKLSISKNDNLELHFGGFLKKMSKMSVVECLIRSRGKISENILAEHQTGYFTLDTGQ